MLSVNLKNIGTVKEGQINLNKLTILCGDNNTGKTYANYAIYGLFKRTFRSGFPYIKKDRLQLSNEFVIDMKNVIDTLEKIIEKETKDYSSSLYEVFSTNKNNFKNSSVNLVFDKKVIEEKFKEISTQIHFSFPTGDKIIISKNSKRFDVNVSYFAAKNNEKSALRRNIIMDIVEEHLDEMLFSTMISKPFLLPAERSGLNLFNKELNVNRNELIHKLGIKVTDKKIPMDLKKSLNPYSEPISDYITFLNSMSRFTKEESEFADLASSLQVKIIKGKYNIDDGNIFYVPFDIPTNVDESSKQISLHVSSSTVKTLFGLVFYLNYMAQEGETLIIDEPELSLHPDNQRKMARILAEIANRGIHVIISTHSDYIIKEFNNLIMLSENFENREILMEKFQYTSKQILNPKDVSSYVFSNGKIDAMEIDKSEGIIAETFNNVINHYNESNDEIYLALMEDQHAK